MNVETLGSLIVVAMVPFATAAAILYTVFFPWRKTREGWAFVNVIWSLALLVDVSVLFQMVPDFPGATVIQLGVLAVILAGLVQLTVSLARLVWRRHKRQQQS